MNNMSRDMPLADVDNVVETGTAARAAVMSDITMQFHPAVEIFPIMAGAEFEGLVADIRDNGQLEAIVICNGMILDGRNRYKACQMLGIEPVTTDWVGTGTPDAFVTSMNLHRPHLGSGQQAMIAKRLATLSHGQKKADAQVCASSRPEAAELAQRQPPQRPARGDRAGGGGARVGPGGRARRQSPSRRPPDSSICRKRANVRLHSASKEDCGEGGQACPHAQAGHINQHPSDAGTRVVLDRSSKPRPKPPRATSRSSATNASPCPAAPSSRPRTSG